MSDKKFTTDENLKKLGKQVRQLRNGHKWSQQKLSEVSGLAVRTISRIERGLMNPSFEVLTILVDVLGISFDSLFTSSDDQDIDIQELIGVISGLFGSRSATNPDGSSRNGKGSDS